MEKTKLNNGIEMPMLGIGTFMLSPDQAENSVYNALKDGYRLIDTANAYMNEKGVGRGIKKSGVPREEIFLETKLWPAFYEEEDQVERTLERLDTDYIDLLLIHQPAGNYLKGYKVMEKAYKEGKVKAIGLSNFNEKGIREILDKCEIKPTVLQTEAHPYYPQTEMKKFLEKEHIKIQAKSNVQIILKWHIQVGNIVIPGATNPDHIKSNIDIFDFKLTDEEMEEIAKINKNTRYYYSTPELLASYVSMKPDLNSQV